MKTLRLERHWSQEQLAQLSGLNVRTIQRLEKGHSVGAETLKALAAVFEMSTDELITKLEQEKQALIEPIQQADQAADNANNKTEQQQLDKAAEKAVEKAKSIRFFYLSSAFLVAIFVLFMLPNYNGGENLGPLIVVFLSFGAMIAGHALVVFEPFGEDWEKRKVAKLLENERKNESERNRPNSQDSTQNRTQD